MNNTWYSLSNIEATAQNIISAKAAVPAGSPWFSGHFPGEPILPGIAELSMVFDVIKNKFTESNNNFKIISFKKVRFKLVVKPEELLSIIITSAENLTNTYSFKITAGEKIACSGIITVEKI
jgi:3-hydroxyacyl-[acyl-carrier-protein] dehydratase